MSDPRVFRPEIFEDERGSVLAVNALDLSPVKRCYFIENLCTSFLRGWQGHNIESRWFLCLKGVFEVYVMSIVAFEKKQFINLKKITLDSTEGFILLVPPGNVTALRSSEDPSRLQVFSDYGLNEVADEIRFDITTFDPTRPQI